MSTTFKELNISNPGTSAKYGGDDTDLINKLFNGVVAGIPAVRIRSQNKFGFDDGILWIYNQALSKKTTIRGQSNAPTTDVDLRLPPITGNDILSALNLEQAWTKKQQFNLGLSMQEMDVPATPGASFHHLYFGTDGHLYSKNSSGVARDYDVGALLGSTLFADQTLQLRNPLGTQTLTLSNPPITADASRTFPIFMSPFKYTVGKIGSTYYVMKYDGTILTSGIGAPEAKIQAAIDVCEADGGGNIFISGYGASNPYTITSTGTPDPILQIGNQDGGTAGGTSAPVKNVRIITAPDAYFKVPNAFTGRFCKVTNATFSCGWDGGYIYQSTPNWLWTGFEFQSDTQAGSFDHRLQNVTISNPGIGIHFNNDGAAGYVNGCRFRNIWMQVPKNGVVFNQAVTYASGANSFNRNVFDNVIMEMADSANGEKGFVNIIGRDNEFWNCIVWDILNTGAPYCSANITANGEYTYIKGGIMTFSSFVDLGIGSNVDDMWSPYKLRKGIQYADAVKTANYTVSTMTDNIVRVNGTSSAFTITLPTAVGFKGGKLTIKRTDIIASSNMIKIATTSSQTIDSAPSQYLAPGECMIVESDDANWVVA